MLPGTMGGIINQVVEEQSSCVLSYTDDLTSTSDLTTYTFSNVAIGTAVSDRYCFVLVVGNRGVTSRSISSVTFNSLADTTTILSEGGTLPFRLCYKLITTGTTMNVGVTFSGSMNCAHLLCWTATGLTQTSGFTTFSSSALSNPSATPYLIKGGKILGFRTIVRPSSHTNTFSGFGSSGPEQSTGSDGSDFLESQSAILTSTPTGGTYNVSCSSNTNPDISRFCGVVLK
jgi:hypothetical protein